jgi:hypothetical protein
MRRYILFLFLSIGLINSYAQPGLGANTNHNISLGLTNAIEITFTAGQSININFSTANNYQNGVISNAASTIRIRSNKRFNLSARSATTHFSSTSATPMPISGVLAARISMTPSFRNLSVNNTALLSNVSRGVRTYDIDYRATPGFNYDAGTYTATIILTATQL